MKTKIKISKKVFNETYLSYLNNYDNFINIFYGGAGSGKSKFLIQCYILKVLKGGRNILAIRKVANTLKKSIFAEFKKVISEWDLYNEFKINRE